MNKRLIAFLSIISLLVFLPLIPASAAAKAGAKCTKVGSTSIVGNKTFTCVKYGQFSAWKKGLVITKPTPTPVDLWQETQFKILGQFKKLQPKAIQELNFVLSPNADKTIAKKLQDSYQEPITYLSNLFVNPAKVTFLVMNENDKEWWLTKFRELSSNQPSDWWGGSHCQPSPRIHCGYGSSPNPDGTFHFGQLLGSEIFWTNYDYTIAYHESIHVYQLGLMGNRMSELPVWFAEGQASYLGPTFSHKYQNSKDQREGPLTRLRNSFPDTSSYKLSDWVTWLKRLDSDSDFTFKNELGYSVGALIMESLYNSNDYTKIHDWMVVIKSGKNYKNAFKEVFGQDYDIWIETTVASYIDSQI